jgi:hypothetical protein
MESGTWNGQHYDGVMTEIRGNHLALVEIGRAGSDVVVGDENPFLKGKKMKRDKYKQSLLAQDADIPAEKLDKIIDALIGVEDETKDDLENNPDPTESAPQSMAGDGSPADKIRELLAGKVEDAIIEEICALATPEVAEVADKGKDEDKKDAPQTAMDAASIKSLVQSEVEKERAKMKLANQARHDVRSIVGDVLALDSADDIYGFALDNMGVAHKGVTDATALKAIFDAANSAQTGKPATTIAQDSAIIKQFPNINRFQRG